MMNILEKIIKEIKEWILQIDDTPYISDIRKDFYKKIIKMRYEKILKETFEKLK